MATKTARGLTGNSSFRDEVKDGARGRWAEILTRLGGVPYEVLDGKHHPCPQCGGKDRFRFIDSEAGACFCNQCFSERNGDGFAALQWLCGWDFRRALKEVADVLGVKETQQKINQVEERPWNDQLVTLWARTKNITRHSVAAAGGRLGRWRRKFSVVVLPIRTMDGTERGQVIYESAGGNLPKGHGEAAKVLVTKGSKTGWLGDIEAARKADTLWKVEGPSDCLALWEAIPEPKRSNVAVLANPFGSKEHPKEEHLDALRGKRVLVCHDTDKDGRVGAARWAKAAATVAREAAIVDLPAENTDLREWLHGGGSYEELEALAERAEPLDAKYAELEEEGEESETDPSRLGREFVRHRAGRILCYHDQVYYWQQGRWTAISPAEFRADTTIWLRGEFHKLNVRSREAAQDPEKPPPKVHKISNPLVGSVMNLAKSYCYVSESIPWGSLIELPEDVQKIHQAKRKRWITVENGILQVDELMEGTGEILVPHTPRWFSPHKLPYRFDERADSSKRRIWQDFLERNLEGNEEKINLLQEWAGYLLLPDTAQQKFLILEGEGANGKSVYCAVLEALVGSDNVSHVPLELFGQRFALTSTLGKLANIATEVGDIDRVAEGYLKSFTSGESMTFDRKGRDPVETAPTARLVIATNNLPKFVDRSEGVWRRMHLVRFDVQIPAGERVLGMDKPGWWRDSGEMPAILNWALEGLMRLTTQGQFSESPGMRQAVDDYRRDSNPARDFLLENYREEEDSKIPCRDVYRTYKEWCTENGYRPMSSGNLGKEVRRAFPRSLRNRLGPRGQQVWHYERLAQNAGLSMPDD